MKIPVYCETLFIAFNTVDIYIYLYIVHAHLLDSHVCYDTYVSLFFSRLFCTPGFVAFEQTCRTHVQLHELFLQ